MDTGVRRGLGTLAFAALLALLGYVLNAAHAGDLSGLAYFLALLIAAVGLWTLASSLLSDSD